jgi:hypothetical protein
MRPLRRPLTAIAVVVGLALAAPAACTRARVPAAAPSAAAPTAADSGRGAVAVPPWRNRVRYGGGPSVGAPPSDYTGAAPPKRWCLESDGRATGDLGLHGGRWRDVSRSWLRQVLSDTTDLGATWRQVLGGAPQLTPADSITEVSDEATCRAVAAGVHRELLGWRVGPPPVVVFRVRDYLIVYPSNARMGEFGFAVGMTLDRKVRGVATW